MATVICGDPELGLGILGSQGPSQIWISWTTQ